MASLARGLGYGALRYLGVADIRAELEELAARVTFNYLGQFDQSFGDDALFIPAQENGGQRRDLDAPLGNWLIVEGQVYDGELSLSFVYSRAMYEPETIEALAVAYKSELEAIVGHCLEEGAGGLTPSDVPLAGAQPSADRGVAGSSARDRGYLSAVADAARDVVPCSARAGRGSLSQPAERSRRRSRS